MKKKIYILLILIIAMLLFVDNVDASTYMWLNCYYDRGICTGECEKSIDWNNFFVVNDSKENPASIAVDLNSFQNKSGAYKKGTMVDTYVGFVSNDCWFSDISDIEEDCSSLLGSVNDDKKIEDPANLLKSGVCPKGVRQYYDKSDGQKYFRVPAGIGLSGPDLDKSTYSLLKEPEFVLYRFKSYPFKTSALMTEPASDDYIYVFEVYDTNGKYGVLFNDVNVSKNIQMEISGKAYHFIRTASANSGSYQLFYHDTSYNNRTKESSKYVNYRDEVISAAGVSQIMRIYYIDDKSSYYKVASEYEAKLVSLISNYHEIDFSADDVETVFSSNDMSTLENDILEWYEINKKVALSNDETLTNIKKMDDLITTSTMLVDSVENEQTFSFGNYNIDDMLNDLEIAYSDLSTYTVIENQYQTIGSNGSMVNVDDPIVAANNFITHKYFNTPILTNYSDEEADLWAGSFAVNRSLVAKTILDAVENNMNKLVENGSISLGFVDEVKDYIKLFSSAIVYLDKYSSDFGLSSEQKNRVNELRTDFAELSNYYDVYVVVDCKGLLGEDLVNRINSFLNIVKIAIPIILIGFGIVDFVKAVFANDDNKMKQAQVSFIKRIGIAILIFFVPVIVNLILTVANEVWSFISPDTCGLF